MISGKRVNICLYSSLIFWDVSSFSWVERKLGTNKKRLVKGLRGKDRLGTLHLKCLLCFHITEMPKVFGASFHIRLRPKWNFLGRDTLCLCHRYVCLAAILYGLRAWIPEPVSAHHLGLYVGSVTN